MRRLWPAPTPKTPPAPRLRFIPVGLGAGKVMQMGKVTVNAFIEPQYTAYKFGEQVPHWQIFAGVNFQF